MADSGPSSGQHNAGDGDDEIAEVDPEGSYCRYREPVGKGRFKTVFKAFNR
jgi:WNK lysine deficient protein kinase